MHMYLSLIGRSLFHLFLIGEFSNRLLLEPYPPDLLSRTVGGCTFSHYESLNNGFTLRSKPTDGLRVTAAEKAGKQALA
jgi:hypothetical protein